MEEKVVCRHRLEYSSENFGRFLAMYSFIRFRMIFRVRLRFQMGVVCVLFQIGQIVGLEGK